MADNFVALLKPASKNFISDFAKKSNFDEDLENYNKNYFK